MPMELRPSIPCQHPGPEYVYDANGAGRWCSTCGESLNGVPSGGFGLPVLLLLLAIVSMVVWGCLAVLGTNGRGPLATGPPPDAPRSSCDTGEPKPTPYPYPGKPVVP